MGRSIDWLVGMVSMLTFAGVFAGVTLAQDKPVSGEGSAKRIAGDELLGEWWTEGNEGRVSFARYRDGTYRGTTSCCAHEDDTERRPKFDHKNPKPELRSRSTLGIVIIWNLKYGGEGEYSDGFVYNPRDGKTYRMKVEVLDADTIKIRGYLGISLLGQSQVWKRYRKGEQPPK